MNLMRSILFEKNMPKEFLPRGVNWIVHVLNQSPTQAVKDMTPEAWSGHKPNVEHFRVFGGIRNVHIPNHKKTKLEDKSMTCILLGLSKGSKAYR